MDPTVFRISIPLLKALPRQDDGAILHCGIASSEAMDLQQDAVGQTLVQKSFDYLRSHGKFNWDHHAEDIGDVLGVQAVTPAEAKELFDADITKAGTACWGTVYPIVDQALASDDLKTAHHRMRAGARLAYSLDGVAVRKSTGEISGVFVPKIAVTPQPVNQESVCCVLSKSLSSVLEQARVSDEDLPEVMTAIDRAPEILVDCASAGDERIAPNGEVRVSKSLFESLVRMAFDCKRDRIPPLGKLREALNALNKE